MYKSWTSARHFVSRSCSTLQLGRFKMQISPNDYFRLRWVVYAKQQDRGRAFHRLWFASLASGPHQNGLPHKETRLRWSFAQRTLDYHSCTLCCNVSLETSLNPVILWAILQDCEREHSSEAGRVGCQRSRREAGPRGVYGGEEGGPSGVLSIGFQERRGFGEAG